MVSTSSLRRRRSRPAALLALACAATIALSASVAAHEDHKKQRQQSEQRQSRTTPIAPISGGMQQQTGAMHPKMGEAMDEGEGERTAMSFTARLLDWLGRLHPTTVHFPISFFPVALFTAIVGRKRPAIAAPVQFLIIAGGIAAPIAAGLGWLDALSADPGPLLTVHRWLGTIIGVTGLALACWAWRRPDQVREPAMTAALSILTAAIVVQGWYGGALVHGIGHLNW